MKRLLLLLFFSLILGTVSFANTFHRSMSGTVNAVTDESITVENITYGYTPQTTFRAHEKRGDSIYEVAAKKSDVKPGQHVVVMAEVHTALQVIIARWRQ